MLPHYSQQFMQDSPFYLGAAILLVSILLAKLAPLPRAMQPFYLYSQLALRLSDKVNHPERSSSQQVTAGLLSIALLLVPFWLIISFLLQLAAYPWFFEFLVLYLCLSDEQFYKVAEEASQTLQHADKPRTRALIKGWLSRDTQGLSEVGLSKAITEKLLTTPIYGTVATMVFFIVGGAPLVLGARMLKQLQLCWPAINPHYRHFGKPAYYLCYMLYYVPSMLWNFTLAIQGGPKALKAMLTPRRSLYAINHHLSTYNIAAQVLDVELGGPVKFGGIKVPLDKVGPPHKPDASVLPRALRLVSSTNTLWIVSLMLVPLIWTALRYL